MAALSQPTRLAIRADVSRRISERREGCTLTKAEFDSIVTAADTFIDVNAAAFNTSLPVVARNKASAQLKSEIFAAVAIERYKVS